MPHGPGTYGSKVGRPPKKGRAANASAKRSTKKAAKKATSRKRMGY
jgi:hypothetical protein